MKFKLGDRIKLMDDHLGWARKYNKFYLDKLTVIKIEGDVYEVEDSKGGIETFTTEDMFELAFTTWKEKYEAQK